MLPPLESPQACGKWSGEYVCHSLKATVGGEAKWYMEVIGEKKGKEKILLLCLNYLSLKLESS